MVIHIVFHTDKNLLRKEKDRIMAFHAIRHSLYKTSNMFGTINTILTKIDDLVWGVPLIVMILANGIFLHNPF